MVGRYNKDNGNKAHTNPALSVLTFNVSDDILDMLAYGKSRGWWCSRSEGMRIALGRMLPIIIQENIDTKGTIQDSIEIELDPNKKYVEIPGRGYIEILGEA